MAARAAVGARIFDCEIEAHLALRFSRPTRLARTSARQFGTLAPKHAFFRSDLVATAWYESCEVRIPISEMSAKRTASPPCVFGGGASDQIAQKSRGTLGGPRPGFGIDSLGPLNGLIWALMRSSRPHSAGIGYLPLSSNSLMAVERRRSKYRAEMSRSWKIRYRPCEKPPP